MCSTCSMTPHFSCRERRLVVHMRVQIYFDAVTKLASDSSTAALLSLGSRRWALCTKDPSPHPFASCARQKAIRTSFHVPSPSRSSYFLVAIGCAWRIAPRDPWRSAFSSSTSSHVSFFLPSPPPTPPFLLFYLSPSSIPWPSSALVASAIGPFEKKLPVAHPGRRLRPSSRVGITRRIGSDGDGDSDGDGAAARARGIPGRAVDERRRMHASQLGICGRERSRGGRKSGAREHGTSRT